MASTSCVLASIVLPSALHFTVATQAQAHEAHVVHVMLRSLYILPIVAAAVWFHLRGALLVSCVVAVTYAVHVVTAWGNLPMENANQVATIAIYLALEGWLAP